MSPEGLVPGLSVHNGDYSEQIFQPPIFRKGVSFHVEEEVVRRRQGKSTQPAPRSPRFEQVIFHLPGVALIQLKTCLVAQPFKGRLSDPRYVYTSRQGGEFFYSLDSYRRQFFSLISPDAGDQVQVVVTADELFTDLAPVTDGAM